MLAQSPAAADTAPDHAAACTIAAEQHPGDECLACSAWEGDPAKCQKRLSNRGYRRSCRGEGASVWSEVWCRRSEAAKKPQ